MRIVDSIQHFPGREYSTPALREVLQPSIEKLGAEETFSEGFFERLGVQTRHLVVDPANPEAWWRENQGKAPISFDGATAYLRLMEGREPLGPQDRLIVVSNVFDTTSPGLGVTIQASLAERMPGFVSPSLLPISGDGCSGFISALREADVWLRAYPGTRVVVVSCEVSSPYFWSPQLMRTLEERIAQAGSRELRARYVHLARGLCIQRFLFGDGCVAALCADTPEGTELDSFYRWTNLEPDDRHLLKLIGIGTESESFPPFGFFAQQPKELLDRLKSDYLPRVREVLEARPSRPRSFAVHAGSGPILDLVQQCVGLTDAEILPSRELLARRGNLNSATGAAIVDDLRRGQQGAADTFCVFFGVGLTIQVAQALRASRSP